MTQTEAQRLAYQLRDMCSSFKAPSHERGVLNDAIQRLDRLEAENKELLMAIDDFDKALSIDCIEHEDWPTDSQIALRNLHAAIAKHQG